MQVTVTTEPRVRRRVQGCRHHDYCTPLRVLATVELPRYGEWLLALTWHINGKFEPEYVVDRLYATMRSVAPPPEGFNLAPVAEAIAERTPTPALR